jgi:antitoxin (DNA-binding transcriptional repressor) of toxin-antitoxin stability system
VHGISVPLCCHAGFIQGLANTVRLSEIRSVREITATEAAKRFSDLLDAVEHRGESFVVVRRGHAIASIAPAPSATGAALKAILAAHPPDVEWAAEMRALRAFAGDGAAEDPWSD